MLCPCATTGYTAPFRRRKSPGNSERNSHNPDATAAPHVIDTSPILNPKTHKVVGVLQVAQPVSWVDDALAGLVRQLVVASAIGILLGALASLLMASRSLRPISRAFQRQREFVADASHELRTPLTLIRTNVEAWLRRANGANRTYALSIVEEVEQLSRIVGDLTTLALADAKQLRIDREPVELNDVVRDLMTQTEPLAEERGVHLRPDLDGGVRVDADLVRVRQLLLILIDNALSHTPSGGDVSVGVTQRDGHARVTVAAKSVSVHMRIRRNEPLRIHLPRDRKCDRIFSADENAH